MRTHAPLISSMRRFGLQFNTPTPKYDAVAIARIAATLPPPSRLAQSSPGRHSKQWRRAVKRLCLRMPYAAHWFVAYCPPGGLQRLRWGSVKRHVRKVLDDPMYLHRLWPRQRKNTDEGEWYARERAHSLILNATHPRPPDVHGVWQPPFIIDGEARRNLSTWPPPNGEALMPETCDKIRAAAKRALEQLPSSDSIPGGPPSDELGFPCVVDELAAIFEASTRLSATVSYNEEGFSTFVRFVSAALSPLANLGDDYRQRFATRANLREEIKRLDMLGRQIGRLRRTRCEALQWSDEEIAFPKRCAKLADHRATFPTFCRDHQELGGSRP